MRPKRWASAHAAKTRTLALLVLFVIGAGACGNDPVVISPGDFATVVTPTGEASADATNTIDPAGTGGTLDVVETAAADEDAAETPSTDTVTAQPAPTAVVRPVAPNGRRAPAVATTPIGLAAQLIAVDSGLRNASATPAQLADFGHLHQVAIRKLGYESGWDATVFQALPPDLQRSTLLHVSARRALIDLSSEWDAADFIPAWEIIDPQPAADLVRHYQEAEAATGIDWEYLAAINLVETGMGRIRGLSSAGAQGPMQFLPTTWTEAGIGEGDINDPRDAINAAARYLVRRGGPDDMSGAIWGYNNSDDYVTAVQVYAELIRQDPAAYNEIYNWEIYFFTEAGDVWLPVGWSSPESVDLDDFLFANPWSEPDAGLR